MKKIIVSISSGLLSESVTRILNNNDFEAKNIGVQNGDALIDKCVQYGPEIIIMDASFEQNTTVENRLTQIKKLKNVIPACKELLLFDETSSKEIARKTNQAYSDGLVDGIIPSSISGTSLVALLTTI